ncbi:MAG: hypothetical protein V1721_09145 [Pseudomonadota bacterium]
MPRRKNIVLIIGLVLPVLLVMIFFVVTVLPKSKAVPPQYEALFTRIRYDHENRPPYTVVFFVKDGTLRAHVSNNPSQGTPTSYQNYWRRLIVYDGKTRSVRDISYDLSKIGEVADGTEVVFDEFKNMKIDGSTKAPDGYEFNKVKYPYEGPMAMFYASPPHTIVYNITKGSASFKVSHNDTRGDKASDYDLQFLGWIVEQK